MLTPTSSDPPLSGSEGPAVRGAAELLPATLDHLARLGLAVSGGDAFVVVLLGSDRRSFTAGESPPAWMAHDPGILLRTGILARAVDAVDVALALQVDDAIDHEALIELRVGGLLVAPIIRGDGLVEGLVAACVSAPRPWGEAARAALVDVARVAQSALGWQALAMDRAPRGRRPDAHLDVLTGLPARSAFLKRLHEAASRAQRDADSPFALLLLDLDDFRAVNESLGHAAGDAALVEVARRLEHCVRGGDLVARLGGDEFALLLERVSDAREPALVAARVQEALRTPMSLGSTEWVASASLGLALSGPGNGPPEAILRSADMAMFRAKYQGRGRIELDDRARHVRALTQLEIEAALRQALERDEFVLHYQPLVRFRDGAVTGVEALVRWNHPTRGLLMPDEFVPVAESSGLIVQLGRWVLRHAMAELAAWERRADLPRGLTLAVNLSAREFAQVDLVRAVSDALAESGVAPGRLHLEITESTLFTRQDVAMDTVAALKALGTQIHVDDFGTGYSSLSYLHRLPLDAIKVDRSFVRAIQVESRARHLVASLVSLAAGIGIDVVAEGVATAGQARLLADMGCTWGQGFHFGRPAPEFEAVRGMSGVLPITGRRRA
ncbi:MAG: EAL domain-containing protein [Gemmatimonadetes bacterium]|nr:EAL domain-containing protein [Gemmatimonadota bacterium]